MKEVYILYEKGIAKGAVTDFQLASKWKAIAMSNYFIKIPLNDPEFVNHISTAKACWERETNDR